MEWDADSNLSDEALAEAYLGGEERALRALIERHHDALLGFLIRMLGGDRGRAEDAFQETFLQVHRSLEGFDPQRRFKPWLFTIAANKARDALRRQKRRPERSLDAPAGGAGDGATVVDFLGMDEEAGEVADDAEARSAMVQRAIDGLTEMQREILLLAYFQQLTYQQLAELLGLPLGTVKSRLHAAVAAFSRNYKQVMELQDGDRDGDREGEA